MSNLSTSVFKLDKFVFVAYLERSTLTLIFPPNGLYGLG